MIYVDGSPFGPAAPDARDAVRWAEQERVAFAISDAR
jgi:hypothetical protein